MKSIRTWVYALLEYKDKIVVIKKSRWPFVWLYDLPGWKIEHWENNINALKRELFEEVWLTENDFIIEKLLTIEEDFIKHIWEWKEKEEHIIAIVYLVKIVKNNLDLNYYENWWDSNWLILLDLKDKKVVKTNILKKVLLNFDKNY